MKYTLMHKRLAVAEIQIDDSSGFVQRINSVSAPEHLPVGVPARKGSADRAALNEWWTDRSIPANRLGVREALETLDVASARMLLLRSCGLSLSDQYWILPENAGFTWEQVNFFSHPFSDDVGDALFGTAKKAEGFDFFSPDNTTDRYLKKRWQSAKERCSLIKGGSNPYRQQPFNEVIASKVMERLGIGHIPYTLVWSDGAPYSVCEDFVTENTELVSAWRIMQTQKKDNSTSVYEHLLNCCKALGAPDIVPKLDQMIALDYIIANEDRHLGNFGLLRNAETLEWLGFAPIFDSGSSLGYDKGIAQIRAGRDIICKPFKKHHLEQLKLVSSFGWIDFEKLSDIGTLIKDVLSDERNSEYMDEDRIAAIASAAERRVQTLESIAIADRPNRSMLSTEDGVEEDIAEDYTPNM